MKDLQEKINKRAEEKLRNKLKEIHNFLSQTNYRFLSDSKVSINVGTSEKPISINVSGIFNHNYPIYDKIFEAHIEKYKEEETILFLQEIENLKVQVSELEEKLTNY